MRLTSIALLVFLLISILTYSDQSAYGNNKVISVERQSNHLKNSLSPYLLQHADNPVDWYPWSDEAFRKATQENKPIFLSIGYSACHWCHVMERESFENDSIAIFLNEHFISIKVDREERPDIDEIYMNAIQIMTGSGGWPLSVFLTPDLKPFYGGTYFPPHDRYGRPGFMHLLARIEELYRTQRPSIDQNTELIVRQLDRLSQRTAVNDDFNREVVERGIKLITEQFDSVNGGFGDAPKFPPTAQVDLLLRIYHRTKNEQLLDMTKFTLKKMGQSGIFDQLGGGFHRYSTDEKWLIPHFEKMLYDNALLTISYLNVYLATGEDFYGGIAAKTLDWVLRDMTENSGGLYSSLDADSEGEEGRFYVWLPKQIIDILGSTRGRLFAEFYGVRQAGNFDEESSVLHITEDINEIAVKYGYRMEELQGELENWRRKLLQARELRVTPSRDDKILTDWNGLMVTALSRGYRALGDKSYLDAANRAEDFIFEKMWKNGRLYHSSLNGKSGAKGLLDDYAFQLEALVELYQAGFDTKRLEQAEMIARSMIELFFDSENGGFYQVAKDQTDLLYRPKSGYDSVIPSGNVTAATAMLKLYQLTDNEDYRKFCEGTVHSFYSDIKSRTGAYLRFVALIDQLTLPLEQIAIIGTSDQGSADQLLKTVNSTYLPNTVLAYGSDNDQNIMSLLENRRSISGKATVYYCQDFSCLAPVTEVDELRKILK